MTASAATRANRGRDADDITGLKARVKDLGRALAVGGDMWSPPALAATENVLQAWSDRWETRCTPWDEEQVQQRLTAERRCVFLLGYDYSMGRFCGQPVIDQDEPCYCEEHRAETQGDEDGVAEEREHLINRLLTEYGEEKEQ